MIWLPYPNVRENLRTLSDEHVFEVVFEGLDCLRNIYSGDLSWRNAKAWAQHPASLLAYVSSAEREMVARGFPAEPRVLRAHVALGRDGWSLAPVPPSWYGDPAFHLAQRSHLIRVKPEYYARRLPFTTPLEMPLIWPAERKFR